MKRFGMAIIAITTFVLGLLVGGQFLGQGPIITQAQATSKCAAITQKWVTTYTTGRAVHVL